MPNSEKFDIDQVNIEYLRNLYSENKVSENNQFRIELNQIILSMVQSAQDGHNEVEVPHMSRKVQDEIIKRFPELSISPNLIGNKEHPVWTQTLEW